MNKQNKNENNTAKPSEVDPQDMGPITKKLDILIRLFIETSLNKNSKFTLTQFVKNMKSAGLDRKEIASILGKKPTDIDPLLYSGKKSKHEQSIETSEEEVDNVG